MRVQFCSEHGMGHASVGRGTCEDMVAMQRGADFLSACRTKIGDWAQEVQVSSTGRAE